MTNIVGVLETREEAENLLRRLHACGVPQSGIGVAMKGEDPGVGTDPTVDAAEAGAVSGAAIGAIIGLAAAPVVLPGLGAFLVWGGLAAALSGAGIGAASGGLVGALIGSEVPEGETHDYLAGLAGGHIVVTASVPDDQADRILAVFREEGATQTRFI